MRIRKIFALMGTVTFFVACFLLYTVMDQTLLPQSNSGFTKEIQRSKLSAFEDRLQQLEGDIHKNQETVAEIKEALENIVEQQNRISALQRDRIIESSHSRSFVSQSTSSRYFTHQTCPLMVGGNSTDVQMIKLYNSLPFDNPDGGVWKQGWNIEYNPQQWSQHRKLKVFLVPHSHNDPGWIKTFEDYYQSQTRSILNNLVRKLSEDSRRKFVWAEISYLQLWWAEQNTESKDQMKRLIESGQLEIVTGGWVMNDEANAHYWSILHQLTEGHEWMQEHLGVKPRYGWAIDPFGHSATMAYLLKRSNFSASLIQRVHYSVKKRLAKDKHLEFRWRQGWGDQTTDMFTHMMPFYSYDVPHTCGPDPKICCQFDFKRLPGYGITCPWHIAPQPITDKNVAARAETLLDQYRKKSQLYRTNAVLIPLGDDFRYDHITEWDAQYTNYQKLFDHMNSRHDLNVEAKFATLADYFQEVRKQAGDVSFPSLSGDFFTYADRDDHYWSGYYTSRPYYKRLDRVLLGYLRAAEILFSISWGQARASKGRHPWLLAPQSGLVSLLTEARQAQALFQHHDGVTGTAKDHVMKDYGQKMLKAINAAQHVIQQCTQFLLSAQPEAQLDPEFIYFHLDDTRPRPGALPERTKITFGEGLLSRRVVLYNSLTRARQEVIRLRVAQHSVKVTDSKEHPVLSQVQPLFDDAASMRDGEYELLFLAELPALSLSTYHVSWVSPEEKSGASPLVTVTLANHVGESTLHRIEGFQDVQVLPPGEDFSISTSMLGAAFSSGGLLKAVTMFKPAPVTVPVHLDFASYGAREGKNQERSGAYLFLPDGAAKIVAPGAPQLVRVMRGPLASQVEVQLPFVLHQVTLYNCSGEQGASIEIQNLVELLERSNTEIAMRFSTNVRSGERFYTDLNAFQMVARQRFRKLPLQAHFYPLSGLAYIEDSITRVSIVSGSPLGVSSLKEGQLEIMQDRRLSQDDNRGLNQGVMDNHPTPHMFRLLVEQREPACPHEEGIHPQATLATQLALQSLISPAIRQISAVDPHVTLHPSFTLYPDGSNDECGLHMITLRTKRAHTHPRAGLVLHQLASDSCFLPPRGLLCSPVSNSLININTLLPGLFGDTMRKSSLTFLDEGEPIPKSTPQSLCPMEIAAYVLGD